MRRRCWRSWGRMCTRACRRQATPPTRSCIGSSTAESMHTQAHKGCTVHNIQTRTATGWLGHPEEAVAAADTDAGRMGDARGAPPSTLGGG
jgi:hypothetical protein